MASTETLDNPIWSALTTMHRELSEGDEYGRRYLPSFTTLAGFAEESGEAYASLLEVTKPRERIGLFGVKEFSVPPIWECPIRFPIVQMICEELKEVKAHSFETLGAGDVVEMDALVKLTQPGPFAQRTIEFGNFIAVKVDGKIAAMSGQRMQFPGFTEVSAVCTHPDHQGRGYARALVAEVCKRIFAAGHTPILHVRTDNAAAIKSYESVGFRIRQHFNVVVLKPPAKS